MNTLIDNTQGLVQKISACEASLSDYLKKISNNEPIAKQNNADECKERFEEFQALCVALSHEIEYADNIVVKISRLVLSSDMDMDTELTRKASFVLDTYSDVKKAILAFLQKGRKCFLKNEIKHATLLHEARVLLCAIDTFIKKISTSLI
jgi:hypothetical protein